VPEGAIGVGVVRARADTQEAIGGVALSACSAVSVELTRLAWMSEIAKVPGAAVCIERARAFTLAEAIEV
jgi:hypothetical protein